MRRPRRACLTKSDADRSKREFPASLNLLFSKCFLFPWIPCRRLSRPSRKRGGLPLLDRLVLLPFPVSAMVLPVPAPCAQVPGSVVRWLRRPAVGSVAGRARLLDCAVAPCGAAAGAYAPAGDGAGEEVSALALGLARTLSRAWHAAIVLPAVPALRWQRVLVRDPRRAWAQTLSLRGSIHLVLRRQWLRRSSLRHRCCERLPFFCLVHRHADAARSATWCCRGASPPARACPGRLGGVSPRCPLQLAQHTSVPGCPGRGP